MADNKKNNIGKAIGAVTSGFGKVGNVLGLAVRGISRSFGKLGNMAGLATKGLGVLTDALGRVSGVVDNYLKIYTDRVSRMEKMAKDYLGPWEKINQATSKFARDMGLSSAEMTNFRRETARRASEGSFGAKYGLSADEYTKLVSGIYASSGRKIGISAAQSEDIAGMNAVMGEESTNEYITRLDAFGVSISDAAKLSGKMFSKASKAGISFKNYSKTFLDNIKMAQTYNFKNGINGVEKMAKMATELKFSMKDAAGFSEKVNNLEGALQVGAQLQALGGSFARFSGPLEMLNESYTSTEDLYKRMVDMFGGMGTFNKQTGQVEINGIDKKRIRVAAEAMGTSYDSIMEGIHATGRRNEIKTQLGNRTDLSDEVKERIMNVGVFQNGKAGVIDTEGNFRELSEITNDFRSDLIALSKTEQEDIKDIAKNTRTVSDFFAGHAKDREADYAYKYERQSERKNAHILSDKYDRRIDKLDERIVRKQHQSAAIEQVTGTLQNIGDTVKGIFSILKALDFTKGAGGGVISGPSHAMGGVKIPGTNIEIEGGEYVINKRSTSVYKPILDAINNDSSSKSVATKKLEDGGVINKPAVSGVPEISGLLSPIVVVESKEESKNRGNYGGKSSFDYSKSSKDEYSRVYNSSFGSNTNNVFENNREENIVNSIANTRAPEIMNISKNNPVVNSDSISRISNITSNDVSNISNVLSDGIKPNIKLLNPKDVVPSVSQNSENAARTERMKMEPIDIKINGTIKLEGSNGASIDISRELLDDRMFISKITDEITKQININRNIKYDAK